MKSAFCVLLTLLLAAARSAAADTPDLSEGNLHNSGQDLVSANYKDEVEQLPQKLPTFGKQTVVIQVEIPVKVVPKWRRYYIANFVEKYASTLNRLIGSEMELAVMSDTPNEKLADAWEAQEIVVPKEFEELPEEAKPRPLDFHNNMRLKSWSYRATQLAEKDFAALKKKLGSAK